MKDYCLGTGCGWLLMVNENGLCEDCEQMTRTGTNIAIQDKFGLDLVAREQARQRRKSWIFVGVVVVFVVYWLMLVLYG